MYANSAIVAKVLMINGVNTLVFKKQVFSVYLVGEMVRMAHTIAKMKANINTKVCLLFNECVK